MTLLEKALEAAANRPSQPLDSADLSEKIEVAIAYYEGRLFAPDVAVAMGIPANEVSARMPGFIRQGLSRGLISVALKANGAHPANGAASEGKTSAEAKT